MSPYNVGDQYWKAVRNCTEELFLWPCSITIRHLCKHTIMGIHCTPYKYTPAFTWTLTCNLNAYTPRSTISSTETSQTSPNPYQCLRWRRLQSVPWSWRCSLQSISHCYQYWLHNGFDDLWPHSPWRPASSIQLYLHVRWYNTRWIRQVKCVSTTETVLHSEHMSCKCRNFDLFEIEIFPLLLPSPKD
jgi:hypothetical protein